MSKLEIALGIAAAPLLAAPFLAVWYLQNGKNIRFRRLSWSVLHWIDAYANAYVSDGTRLDHRRLDQRFIESYGERP